MRNYLISGFLGMVDGFTEFIPISSTAHRRLAEAALRLSLSDKFWKLQLVIVQLGATFGLLALFDLKLRMATRPVRQNVNELPRLLHTAPAISVGWALLSTIVSAFALTQMIDRNFNSLTVIGSSLLIGDIVMWSSDRLAVCSSLRAGGNVTTLQAVWLGACQTLAAVFPGTSCSMATIIAGEIGGLSRPAAVEFSFPLFVPLCSPQPSSSFGSLSRTQTVCLSINTASSSLHWLCYSSDGLIAFCELAPYMGAKTRPCHLWTVPHLPGSSCPDLAPDQELKPEKGSRTYEAQMSLSLSRTKYVVYWQSHGNY